MNRLILVKHAMPSIDPTVPAPEWVLSADGRNQSLCLADRLRPYHPYVVISSDEPKAKETAEIVGQRVNQPVEVVHDLHEHDRRGVPYMGGAQLRAAVLEFFGNPSALVFGGETADEAWERFHRALMTLVSGHDSHNMVVVTHGTVISLFVARMTGLEPYPFWERLGLPSFVVLSWPKLELLEVVDRLG